MKRGNEAFVAIMMILERPQGRPKGGRGGGAGFALLAVELGHGTRPRSWSPLNNRPQARAAGRRILGRAPLGACPYLQARPGCTVPQAPPPLRGPGTEDDSLWLIFVAKKAEMLCRFDLLFGLEGATLNRITHPDLDQRA